MLKKFNKRDRARLFWATALSLALFPVGEITFNLPSQFIGIKATSPAYAKRSGGRSGGGSFRSSGSRRSSSSRSNSSNSGSSSHIYYHHTTYGRSYYGYGSTSSTFAWGIFWIIFTLFALVLVAALLSNSQQKNSKREREIDNKIVTISQIQVALLAQAKSIQSQLSTISLSIDPNTSEGLTQLLQESALVLLRSPEHWQYVLASSQKCDRDRAETVFNQLSIQQRSKFSAETLVNVAGRRSRQDSVVSSDAAEYIVVTLLIGTAHDKPLFDTIRTTEALTQVLQSIAAIDPKYLLKFELLWTPQSETDSLTYVELLSEYADMVPL